MSGRVSSRYERFMSPLMASCRSLTTVVCVTACSALPESCVSSFINCCNVISLQQMFPVCLPKLQGALAHPTQIVEPVCSRRPAAWRAQCSQLDRLTVGPDVPETAVWSATDELWQPGLEDATEEDYWMTLCADWSQCDVIDCIDFKDIVSWWNFPNPKLATLRSSVGSSAWFLIFKLVKVDKTCQ